jgi:hypothetical protein
MRAYRAGWRLAVSGLALVSLLAAAISSLSVLLVLFVGCAVVGAAVVLLVRRAHGARGQAIGVRGPLLGACVAGSSVGAFTGLTTIIGPVAVLVLLVAAATSPWAVRFVQGWLRAVLSSDQQFDTWLQTLAWASPGLVPFQPFPLAQPMTDQQLCEAWCATYPLLATAGPRRAYLRIVQERDGYLDELQGRHPAAFAAWLASGATPSSDPLPFLKLPPTDRETINWDELIGGQDQR